ncbi:MAG: hypothetical protein V1837_06985 [Candidatus Woesearchaeota archaeon]
MKGLLLISGGIDSPVAGYKMLKLGCELSVVHFCNADTIDGRALRLTTLLAENFGRLCFFSVPHRLAQESFAHHCNRRFQCLLCKRMMYMVSERLALKHGMEFLLTGENLGQVASQTLENMSVIDSAVKIPVLRPLLCAEKAETINLAKSIGTFQISSLAAESCPFVPRHPLTKARLDQLLNEEKRVDVQSIIEQLIKGTKTTWCG